MSELKVSRMQVTNFRNLQPDIINFSQGINCIFGQNGNGKTNLLEALYVLTQRKSFRKNTSFPQYLSIDGDSTEIIINSLFLDENGDKLSLSTKLQNGSSTWSINGKPTKKRLEATSIFINPFDSYTFHNSASFRRHWVDHHLGLINKLYAKNWAKFQHILRNRNALLSQRKNGFKEQILALDEQLVQYSLFITKERESFISDLRDYCSFTFNQIFSQEHFLDIKLSTRFSGQNEAFIWEFYRQNQEKDEAIGHTSYGIHKDDYQFFFDGMNAYEYCSLGQQKMSYLSLIFAYIELFRYKFKAYPIVLIDDVSGELDTRRWANLIEYLQTKKFQVLITTANESFKDELHKSALINQIKVEAGAFHVVQ